MRLLLFSVTLLFLLALTSCSDSEGASVDPSSSGFADALGLGSSEETLDEAVFYRVNDVLNGSVRECMAEEGFEYLLTADAATIGRVGDGGALTDEEYASEFGFGIWTSVSGGIGGLPDLEKTNPNDEYLQGLSDQEIEVWRDTLELCTRAGWEEEDALYAIIQPFEDARVQIEEELLVDPRVVGAEQEWSRCMANEGYGYGSASEMFQSLVREAQELVVEGADSGEAVAVAPDQSMPDSERDREFRAREIGIAEANHECGKELRTVMSTVRTELEEKVLGSNSDLRTAAEEFAKLDE